MRGACEQALPRAVAGVGAGRAARGAAAPTEAARHAPPHGLCFALLPQWVARAMQTRRPSSPASPRACARKSRRGSSTNVRRPRATHGPPLGLHLLRFSPASRGFGGRGEAVDELRSPFGTSTKLYVLPAWVARESAIFLAGRSAFVRGGSGMTKRHRFRSSRPSGDPPRRARTVAQVADTLDFSPNYSCVLVFFKHRENIGRTTSQKANPKLENP